LFLFSRWDRSSSFLDSFLLFVFPVVHASTGTYVNLYCRTCMHLSF
jgi:hypothetical protein